MGPESTKPDSVVAYVPPNSGPRLWVAEELLTFVVTGAETGGRYALTDSTVPPRGAAPPHVHHREDEAFWVLAGELEVRVGEQTFRAEPGAFVHLPKGVPHSYENVGAGPARFLTLIVPAGLEQFFVDVGRAAADDASSPPPFEQADLQELLAVAPRYGVQILPPPTA